LPRYIYSFWSDQYEHKLEYVGHATKWDQFVVRGSVEERRLVGFYLWLVSEKCRTCKLSIL
jgi:Reductase C-terminal